jgi:hypothetical protein
MSGTASAAHTLASKWVGWREGPRNNETPFGAYTGYQFQPWCGSFVKFVLDKTGTTGEPSPVYTPAGVNAYRREGRWLPNTADPPYMSVVFFRWPGSPFTADHVGFVTRREGDRIWTIEGNTSPSDRGSQGNGGGVYERVRPLSVVVGYGLPRYGYEPPPVPDHLNPSKEDDVSKLIDAPNGTTWLCHGVFRRLVTPEDANVLQFTGVPRTRVEQSFWDLVERTLIDAAAIPQTLFTVTAK